MARILYGIHGTGHGHAMRGLILARSLPQHEFLFVASDDAPAVLEPEFRVARLPNLGTVFKNYRVDLGATIRRALPLLLNRKKYIRQTLKIIEDFRPDVCMTDLEYNVIFHRRSEDEFASYLEGCAYVIQGGSHTLMSEALYLGKPILSLPLLAMVEQRFNALYLERLGYGIQTTMADLGPELLERFENDLPRFRRNMAGGRFLGNQLVFGLVDRFATSGQAPDLRKILPEYAGQG